jgi:hypothetical protein
MTAFDLIDSIFSRASWGGAAANVRRITPDQLKYLRDLIEKDAESHKARAGAPGSLVWMPAGPHKYVVTEDLVGNKHTLTRLSNIVAQESGRLFL